jgi:protein TonB
MAEIAHRRGRDTAAFTLLNEKYVRFCLYCLVVSAIAHTLYILYGAGPPSKPYQLREKKIEVIDVPDEIYIPPPPPEVERPEIPQEAEITENPDIEDTIEETSFNPFSPPVALPARTQDEQVFVAYDTPPQIVRKVEPPYPDLAREAHAEGIVKVQMTIDETGRVIEAVVVSSDAIPSLEEAALKAARAFLWRPAKQRDVAVKCRVTMDFRFELN